jgi:hypothetical protein
MTGRGGDMYDSTLSPKDGEKGGVTHCGMIES